MRVLLVATNQADRFMDRMVVRPVPIGLAYIAAAVDENRHELKVLDLMFSDDGAGDVESAVRDFRPDLVGLSIRNLDNQSYFNPVSNLPGVRDIVERIRSVSDATILCGGPAFGILPAECLEYVGADLGIAGDAGEAFATLLDRLESGADYAGIPGMVYRRDGEVSVSEGRFTSYFHNAPRLDLLNMQRYNGSGFGVGRGDEAGAGVLPHIRQRRGQWRGVRQDRRFVRGVRRQRLAHPRSGRGGGRGSRAERGLRHQQDILHRFGLQHSARTRQVHMPRRNRIRASSIRWNSYVSDPATATTSCCG